MRVTITHYDGFHRWTQKSNWVLDGKITNDRFAEMMVGDTLYACGKTGRCYVEVENSDSQKTAESYIEFSDPSDSKQIANLFSQLTMLVGAVAS